MNDKGQTGPMIVFILAIIVFALVYIVESKIVAQVISLNNIMISTLSLPCSAERVAAVVLFCKYWYAFPIIVLFGLFLWGIREAIRARSGEVE